MTTTLVCPHCGVMAHFTSRGGYELPWRNAQEQNGDFATLLSCDRCYGPVVTLRWKTDPEISCLWPQSVVNKSFPDVPDHIVAAAIEAHRCSTSEAPRASVTMARAAIEAVAKDKGITSGPLVEKIEALHIAGHISGAMKEAAHEIRFAGNEAAHGDITHENISIADAEEIVALMDAILERVYQEPARVERVRQRRLARRARTTPERAQEQGT